MDGLAVVLTYLLPLPFLFAVFVQAFSTFRASSSFLTLTGSWNEPAVKITALLVALGCGLPGILMCCYC